VKKASEKNLFVTALVGDSFGLEGFVKLNSLSGETEHLLRLKSALLLKGTGESNGETGTRRTIEEAALRGDGAVLVRFSGVETCEEAKKLRGMKVLVEREFAAPLSDGEYYIEDLKGLSIICGNKAGHGEKPETVGIIEDIVEGGGGFLAQVKLNSSKTCFIPFRNEFLGAIDHKKQTIALLAPWIIEENL